MNKLKILKLISGYLILTLAGFILFAYRHPKLISEFRFEYDFLIELLGASIIASSALFVCIGAFLDFQFNKINDIKNNKFDLKNNEILIVKLILVFSLVTFFVFALFEGVITNILNN